MDKRSLKATIDIKNAKMGKNNYIISAAHIMNVPKGVIITSISPASIVLEFAPVVKPADTSGEEFIRPTLDNITETAKGKK